MRQFTRVSTSLSAQPVGPVATRTRGGFVNLSYVSVESFAAPGCVIAAVIHGGPTIVAVGPTHQFTMRIEFGSEPIATEIVEPARSLPGLSADEVITSTAAGIAPELLLKARQDFAAALHTSSGRVSLKQLRLRAGLSQADVAVRLHTSQPYIARLEGGTVRNPGKRRLQELAEAYGVDISTVIACIDG